MFCISHHHCAVWENWPLFFFFFWFPHPVTLSKNRWKVCPSIFGQDLSFCDPGSLVLLMLGFLHRLPFTPAINDPSSGLELGLGLKAPAFPPLPGLADPTAGRAQVENMQGSQPGGGVHQCVPTSSKPRAALPSSSQASWPAQICQTHRALGKLTFILKPLKTFKLIFIAV